MRLLRIVPILLVLALAAGCSSVNVTYDYDPDANFAGYSTYGWLQRPGETSASAHSGLLDSRLRKAIDGVLRDRGLKHSQGQPDLQVVYHVGTKDKIQVTDWGYHYSPYWGYQGRDVDVMQYTEGTLIIDLIDSRTKDLVWRGTGTGVVDRSQKSPEQLQARLDDVVARIMKSFPPQ